MNQLIEQGMRLWFRSPEQFGAVVEGRNVSALIHLPLLQLGDPLSESQLALFEVANLTRRVWAWFHFAPTVVCFFPDDAAQVDRLGESVVRRYFQLQGIHMDYPSFCYTSPMIQRIAAGFDLPQNNLAKLPMTKVAKRLKGESVERCLEYASEQLAEHEGMRPDEWIAASKAYDRIKGRPYRIEISSSPDQGNAWMNSWRHRTVRRSLHAAWDRFHQQHTDQLSVDRSLLSSHVEFWSLLEQVLKFPLVMAESERDRSVAPLLRFDDELRPRLSSFLQQSSLETKPSVESGGLRVIDHVLQQLTAFGLYPSSSCE